MFGLGLCRPNPNPRQIRPIRLDRLAIMTWAPRLTSVDRQNSKSSMAIHTRLPSGASLGILAGITKVTSLAIRINFLPWLLGRID